MMVALPLALWLAAYGSGSEETPPLEPEEDRSWPPCGSSSESGRVLQCVGDADVLEWPRVANTTGSFVVASGSEWLVRGVSPGASAVRSTAFPLRITLESAAVLVLQRTRMQELSDWHGGALSAHEGSDLTVAFCGFVDNRADHTGGAIWIGPRTAVHIDRTVFERN